MARILKSELVEITEEESQKLAKAITRVTELYEIKILPEKSMAWINLLSVMGGVYGTRLMAMTLKPKKPKPGATVINMPPQPNVQAGDHL